MSEHVIPCSAETMGQDALRCLLAVLTFEPPDIRLHFAGFTQKQNHSFGKGPRQIGITDFAIRTAGTFAAGFLDRSDQTRIRGKLLWP